MKTKNAIVFDLKEAIEQKLAQMVKQNPIRLEFYEKYKTIIAEYNAGKDIQAVQKAFDDLCDLMEDDLTPEQERSLREGLDEETLAIYDILKKPSLSAEEEKEVKKVAIETLARLKEEKLKIERWQESTQLKSQVKVMIKNSLYWLPTNAYINDELSNMSLLVYQHVYANYQGAGNSTYGSF
ncbi:type I restriction enzyme endonuclease domain-containing protein [Pseudoalteromonas holothuriae]|nr:type I restriction enzyme endonuclease domain-containing protein [Pseudoalteromonas sp. CIP111854]